jgi:hypothetical protein
MRLQGVLNVLNKKQLFALNEYIGKYSHTFMVCIYCDTVLYKSEKFLSIHDFHEKNCIFQFRLKFIL